MRAQNYGRIVMTTSSIGPVRQFRPVELRRGEDGAGRPDADAGLEGAKNDIRVNCLAPTAATRMTENLMPEAVLELLRAGRRDARAAGAGGRRCPDARDPVRRRGRVRARLRHAHAGRLHRPPDDAAEQVVDAWSRASPTAAARACPRAARPGHAGNRQGDARGGQRRFGARAPARRRSRCASCGAAHRQVGGSHRRRPVAAVGRSAVLEDRLRGDASNAASRAVASHGRRLRQRPPSQPASTSPVPALASAALPVALTPAQAGRRDHVPEPFRTTTRRSARPARARHRAGRPEPARCCTSSRRAASSGCGVSTVGRPRGARGQRRLQAAVGRDGIQRIGVEHQAARQAQQARQRRCAPRRRRRNRRRRRCRR